MCVDAGKKDDDDALGFEKDKLQSHGKTLGALPQSVQDKLKELHVS